ARLCAGFCVLGKVAQAVGQLRFQRDRLRSSQAALIEYKECSVDGPVAYLVNQYPHASHSFIRREIAALEKQGVRVARFSVRASGVDLVDAGDRAEAEQTTVLLAAGKLALAGAFLAAALTRPFSWLAGIRQ